MRVILGGDRRGGSHTTVGSEMIGPLWPESTSQQLTKCSVAAGGVDCPAAADETARLERGADSAE